MQPIIVSGAADYTVIQKVGEFPNFIVYICRLADGTECLFKIASDASKNGLLDREAFTLTCLQTEMNRRDDEYRRKSGGDKGLGFKHCIPQLVDSFIAKTQSGRRANVISVYGAETILELVPLQQWRTRENKRIDPKSSAWIMGRLLKIFTLTHPGGIAASKVNGESILINPARHHVSIFDWTEAVLHEGKLPQKIAQKEIAAAAREVILALGGNLESKTLPDSDQLTDNRYATMLFGFASGLISDPFKAGEEFYGLLDDLWGKSFHPFTIHSL